MTGSELEVPGAGNTFCKPQAEGTFSYTVTATDHDPLDPVLIIEPQLSLVYKQMTTAPDQQPPDGRPGTAPGDGSGGLMLVVGLVIGVIVGVVVGRKMD